MTDHELHPGPDTVSDVLTADRTPVLTVAPGDRVTVRTLDCNGNLPPEHSRAESRPLIAASRGHCLAGPIAVTGARPGQVLAVTLESLTPDPWGSPAPAGTGTPTAASSCTAPSAPRTPTPPTCSGSSIKALFFKFTA